jgi:hypothetical protein
VSRRRAARLGALVAAFYLVGAALSARLDPLNREPVLDGLAPPPTYRWVEPPAALASTNQPPETKVVTLSQDDATYDPATGSAAAVYATADYQTTLTLAQGAIAPRSGASEVVLTIEPSAPDPGAVTPDGYEIAGNVVEVTATYRPAGGEVTAFAAEAHLMLAFPSVFGGIDDTLMTSTDGITWRALPSTNHLGQQLVVGKIRRLGLFAVGQTAGSTPTPSGGAEGFPAWLIAVLVGLAVTAALTAVAARRGARGSSPRRPPPPRGRADPFDPWQE